MAADRAIRRRARSAVTAAVLSMLAFGAGHLYVGAIRRALLPLVVIVPAILAIGWSGRASSLSGFGLILVLVMGLWLWGVVDSARRARAATQRPSAWYARVHWYVAWIALAVVARWGFIQAREPVLGFNTFRVATPRMEPVLRRGDFILVDARAYRQRPAQLGDVVVVRDGEGRTRVRYVASHDAQEVELSTTAATDPGLRARRDAIVGRATVIWWSRDGGRIGRAIGNVTRPDPLEAPP